MTNTMYNVKRKNGRIDSSITQSILLSSSILFFIHFFIKYYFLYIWTNIKNEYMIFLKENAIR